MLKNIPKILTPDLIKILCEMGHGDEIVIADANFPSANYAQRLVRADGLKGCDILQAVLNVLPLDTYSEFNFLLMNTVKGDPIPEIWEEYKSIANNLDKMLK
jgi:L-fucose mutarotase